VHYRFEWDRNKARINLAKHKILFEEAAMVFRDEHAISIPDDGHSQTEERWITIGMDESTRTLVVVHTFMSMSNTEWLVRIISARKASKKEQQIYFRR
jgi:uncharacterized DUF497 family protein